MTLFTQRHYRAFADLLKRKGGTLTTEDLIDLFQADSSKFNQQLFREKSK